MLKDLFFESDPAQALGENLKYLRELADEHSPLLWSECERVQAIVQKGLASDRYYDRAVEVIFSLIAAAVSEPAAAAWFEPIVALVEQQPVSEGRIFESGFRKVTGEFRNFVGVYTQLNSVRITVVDDLFQAYIRLIKLLTYRQSLGVTHQLFDQADRVAQRLDDRIETAKLYQTLALYHAHTSEFEAAEHYALLAFNISEMIDDPGGIADAACTVAIAYRSGHRFERAGFFIERALKKVPADTVDKRFATLFYEYAVFCYRGDQFERALSYFEQALTIYEHFEAAYQIAMTKQGMTLAYMYLHQFAQADECLSFARRSWETLGNRFEYVNTFFAAAEVEFNRGNRPLALKMLHQTIDKAYDELPDTAAREGLIELIKTYIEAHFGIDS